MRQHVFQTPHGNHFISTSMAAVPGVGSALEPIQSDIAPQQGHLRKSKASKWLACPPAALVVTGVLYGHPAGTWECAVRADIVAKTI